MLFDMECEKAAHRVDVDSCKRLSVTCCQQACWTGNGHVCAVLYFRHDTFHCHTFASTCCSDITERTLGPAGLLLHVRMPLLDCYTVSPDRFSTDAITSDNMRCIISCCSPDSIFSSGRSATSWLQVLSTEGS